MSLQRWIKRFWREAYGRNFREMSVPNVDPVNLSVVIINDMGEFHMILVTESNNGVRRVWREVKP